GDAAAQPEK
nr:RecName: Full=Unknown protein 4 [Ginkgo biloba]